MAMHMEGNADREGISRVTNGMESIWSLGWKEKHMEGEGYRRKHMRKVFHANQYRTVFHAHTDVAEGK
jgi:hypothetical protein